MSLRHRADQPVGAIRSLDEVIARSISTPRLRTTLVGSVPRRTNEIGIRVALGATQVSILAMIARESLSSFLFGVTPSDALASAAVTALLTLVSLAACLV